VVHVRCCRKLGKVNDTCYWVGFDLVKGIGAVRLQSIRNHFRDLALAWQTPLDASQVADLSLKLTWRLEQMHRRADLEKVLTRSTSQGIETLTWEAELNPPHLKEIDQPPPVLNVRAAITPEDFWAVAVFETRRVGAFGEQVGGHNHIAVREEQAGYDISVPALDKG
jgi:DNA processing protein